MQHQDNKFSGHVIFWKLNPSSSEQVLRGVTRKLWRGFFFSLATFCALTIASGCYRVTLYAFYWKLRSAHFSVAPCIMSRHDQVGLSSCANQTPALKKTSKNSRPLELLLRLFHSAFSQVTRWLLVPFYARATSHKHWCLILRDSGGSDTRNAWAHLVSSAQYLTRSVRIQS